MYRVAESCESADIDDTAITVAAAVVVVFGF
jgi:hypothetical protein